MSNTDRPGITFSIYVPRDLLRMIDRAAQSENRSRSNMVNTIIERWLAANNGTHEAQADYHSEPVTGTA